MVETRKRRSFVERAVYGCLFGRKRTLEPGVGKQFYRMCLLSYDFERIENDSQSGSSLLGTSYESSLPLKEIMSVS